MKRETFVSIPQPCHESWEAMTLQEQGRFCASCAKTVIDFSQMSDAQVLNYLSQSTGRLCGRFAQDQVERPLTPLKPEKKRIWWIAALMPLTLLQNKANGQFKTEKKLADVSYAKRQQSMGSVAVGIKQTTDAVNYKEDKIINGTVVDNHNIPIAGASILLKGTTIGTTTDTTGKFTLHLTTTDSLAKLIISSVGYEEEEVNCTFNHTNEVNIDTRKLRLSPALQGDVVVVVGYTIKRHPVKKIDTIKTTVCKILRINAFKVYPNPVERGQDLHLEVKKEGHYSIQLLDVHSNLVANSVFDAVKGGTTTVITIPPSATAGIYFIRLINDGTKQQYTDKIIVQ